MARAQTFQDLDNDDSLYYNGREGTMVPFWALINRIQESKDSFEKELLDWQNDTFDMLLDWKEGVTRVQHLNVQLYKGNHYAGQSYMQSDRRYRTRRPSNRNAQIVVNHLHELTEQHVARMTSYSPRLDVTATNDEERDRIAARMNKALLDHYYYENDMDALFQIHERRRKIMGENYIFVLWNPDVGDVHPAQMQLQQLMASQGLDPNQAIPLLDPETGEEILDEDGIPIMIDQAARVGDVECVAEYSERVVHPYPASGLWKDVNWVTRYVPMPIEEAKARWAHIASDLEEDDSYGHEHLYRKYHLSTSPIVWVRYMYHRPTPFLDKGYYCVSTRTAICEVSTHREKFGARHMRLPVVRGTDIDIPGELVGASFYQQLSSMQYALNNSTSAFLQNQLLCSKPKWMIPRGARIKSVDLGDEKGHVEYSGGVPPRLEAPNSTPTDTIQFREMMRSEMETIAAVYGTSRGDPPSGVTANVALRMLAESEERRQTAVIKKRNSEIKDTGTLILYTMGHNYQADDNRLVRIIGPNSEYQVKQFDVSNLTTSYEVQVEKTTQFAESKAAKTQLVFDIAERRPNAMSDEEMLEHLEVPRPEKVIQAATVAQQTAEAEMEELLQGKIPSPPQEFDEILPKYRVYIKRIQSRAFREETPVGVKANVFRHIVTAEYIMWKKQRLNQHFAQKLLMEFPYFPMFFKPPAPDLNPVILDTIAMQQAAMAGGPLGLTQGSSPEPRDVGEPPVPEPAAGPEIPQPEGIPLA